MSDIIDAEFEEIIGCRALQTQVLSSGWKRDTKNWFTRQWAKVVNWASWLWKKAMNGLKWAVKLVITFYIMPFQTMVGQLILMFMGGLYAYGLILCIMGAKWALCLALLVEFFMLVTQYCGLVWMFVGGGMLCMWFWRKWGRDAVRSVIEWTNNREV